MLSDIVSEIFVKALGDIISRPTPHQSSGSSIALDSVPGHVVFGCPMHLEYLNVSSDLSCS